MSLSALAEQGGNLNWQRYFIALGQANPGEVNVAQKEFMREVGAMISTKFAAQPQILPVPKAPIRTDPGQDQPLHRHGTCASVDFLCSKAEVGIGVAHIPGLDEGPTHEYLITHVVVVCDL
jgi:hypothetical protein